MAFDWSPKKVEVDYNASWEYALAKSCVKGLVSDIKEENFPFRGRGKVSPTIKFTFVRREASPAKVITHLRLVGRKPVGIEHLIALASWHKDWVTQLPPHVVIGALKQKHIQVIDAERSRTVYPCMTIGEIGGEQVVFLQSMWFVSPFDSFARSFDGEVAVAYMEDTS